MKVKISEKNKKTLLVSITVLWIAFIFSNSLQNAERSSQTSGFVMEILTAIFGDLVDGATLLIRKLAHFTEFSVLGMFLFVANSQLKKEQTEVFIKTALFGLMTALCDETIQLFSEGRSGQISDVWIDFFGLLFGISVIILIKWLKNKKNQKQRSVLE